MTQTTTMQPGLPKSMRRLLQKPIFATLAAPHGVDRYLEAINPLWSVNEVRAEVVAVRNQTPGSLTLSLRPNNNWRGFKPGQFVRLSAEVDGVRRMRCFSPANSVHAQDGLLELTLKINPNGQLTQYLNDNAKPGMVVGLSQADGSFALPDTRPDRILLISGGSGITPVMSMLRSLCAEGYARQITFLHYANSAQEVIYSAELDDLSARYSNVRVIRAYAQPNQGGDLEGFFSREHLLKAAPDYASAQTFLCGPGGMMQAVQKVFDADGLGERLHLEHFSAPTLAPVSSDAKGEVRFIKSERYITSDGRSLLDQAEAAGLKPESGCRMGICHACTCRKTSGQVRDLRNGQLSESGEESIQLCISVPVGTVTLDL